MSNCNENAGPRGFPLDCLLPFDVSQRRECEPSSPRQHDFDAPFHNVSPLVASLRLDPDQRSPMRRLSCEHPPYRDNEP